MSPVLIYALTAVDTCTHAHSRTRTNPRACTHKPSCTPSGLKVRVCLLQLHVDVLYVQHIHDTLRHRTLMLSFPPGQVATVALRIGAPAAPLILNGGSLPCKTSTKAYCESSKTPHQSFKTPHAHNKESAYFGVIGAQMPRGQELQRGRTRARARASTGTCEGSCRHGGWPQIVGAADGPRGSLS